jgi:hypothetical protein
VEVKQSSFGFWFIYLNDEPISGGTLDKQAAIEEMELMK